MYSEKVMKHFMNPKNVGEIKNPDGLGIAGNINCGDIMKLYLRVKDDRIVDIKFKTLGCAAAIATSSIVTELAKNKKVMQALELTNKEVIEELDGLPVPKIHCSLLAIDALKEAIYDYLEKHNKKIPKGLEKDHERISRDRESLEHNH